MKVRWDGDVAYADREYVAAIYRKSEMTVRRYCTPAYHEPHTGPGTGRAMYNVEVCGAELGDVDARPWQTVKAMRTRDALMREQLRDRMRARSSGHNPDQHPGDQSLLG